MNKLVQSNNIINLRHGVQNTSFLLCFWLCLSEGGIFECWKISVCLLDTNFFQNGDDEFVFFFGMKWKYEIIQVGCLFVCLFVWSFEKFFFVNLWFLIQYKKWRYVSYSCCHRQPLGVYGAWSNSWKWFIHHFWRDITTCKKVEGKFNK